MAVLDNCLGNILADTNFSDTVNSTVVRSLGLTISGTPVLTETTSVAYDGFTVSASGGVGPYTFSLVGSWPSGLSVDSSTGVVSGTATVAGSYTGLSVRVTDSLGVTADLPTFTLYVGTLGPYFSPGYFGTSYFGVYA